jgi:hypothetical protein
VRVAASVGATVRGKTRLLDATMGNELSAQVGAAYDLKPRWRLPLEAGLALATAVSASNPFGRANETSAELRGYGAYDLRPSVRLLAGGGAGLESGWGTPDWRIFAGAQLGFPRRPVPTVVPGRIRRGGTPAVGRAPGAAPPAPCAPPDTDGDGLADADDRCPTVVGPPGTADARTRTATGRRGGPGGRVPDLAGCRTPRRRKRVKLEADRIGFGHHPLRRRAASSAALAERSTGRHRHHGAPSSHIRGGAHRFPAAPRTTSPSVRRARSVARALVARASRRRRPAGLGSSGWPTTTRDGRAKNRRVEPTSSTPHRRQQ